MPRYGFIRTKDDIKFLVLHAMRFLEFPVTYEAVVDLCTWCDDGFGYFELTEAFQEMVASGHIRQEDGAGEALYEITSLGRDAAEVFEHDLPFTVREAAQKSALRVVRKLRRETEIKTHTTPAGDSDLIVHLEMDAVFSMDLHVVSRSQASLLEQNFRRHAEKIYNVLLEALIRDYDEPEGKDAIP